MEAGAPADVSPADSAVELRVLGRLEGVQTGRPIDLPALKARAVLGMLLIHPNQVVSADRLADGLWGDDHPHTALNTLQGYVSQLRKVLGPGRIQTQSPGYVLCVDPELIDATRFERLLDKGRRARADGDPGKAVEILDRAMALWRGDPLADFTYAEWAQAEIARLGELRLVAIEEWIEARMDLGHHDQLVGELDGLVVAHPLRERLWAARILALYRSGRQADALRAYQELRSRLGEEVGIDPSSELVRLEASVLAQDASLQWRPPPDAATSRLPAPRSTFVGRDEELRELEKLVRETGMVTVAGAGGVGKTRLAIEVARRLSSDYDDVRLVELAALSEPSLVLQEMATACGVREEPGRRLLDTLASALRSRRVLLLLDNCEHLLDATASLADALLRAAPDVAILATSRQPLRIDGERVWRAPSLPMPPAGDVSPEAALGFDAARLFMARATDVDACFSLTPENASAVAEICRRLDGIPLAIELAAARITALTPAQIAARLDDRFRLLRSGSRAALARHRTLSAAVQWSYDLCSPSEQALFQRLSVFAGGFTLEAAEAVCADLAVPGEELLDLLSSLVDRSLVVVQHRGDGARYHLLETIRAYAEQRLAEAGEDQAIRDAHLAWAVAFAEAIKAALPPQLVTQKATLERVELEHDNIRKALTRAASVDPEAVLRIVAAIGDVWVRRGYFEESKQWSDFVVAAARDVPPPLRAAVLRWAGGLAFQQGDVRRGRPIMEEAMATFRELGHTRSVSFALQSLSWSAIDHERDYHKAERLARESLAILEEDGDEHLVSEAIGLLALVTMERGDEITAKQLIDKALAYNLTHADDPCLRLVNMAGRIDLLCGDLAGARRSLEQDLADAREMGRRVSIASPLHWLGQLALLDGEIEEAADLFTEQLAAARGQGNWRGTRLGLLGMAKVHIRRGEVVSARSALDEVRQMSRARSDATDPSQLEMAAELLAAEGRLVGAARTLGAAEAYRETLGARLPPTYRAVQERIRSEIASGLEPEAFATAWAQGGQLPAETALEEALGG